MVIEAAQFPRFSIGESLLPQVTECLQTAGLLDAVSSAGFQYKDGAHFVCGDLRETFLFEQKSFTEISAYEMSAVFVLKTRATDRIQQTGSL